MCIYSAIPKGQQLFSTKLTGKQAILLKLRLEVWTSLTLDHLTKHFSWEDYIVIIFHNFFLF